MKEGRHDRDNISIPDTDAAANAEVREICGPTVSQKGATVISAFVKNSFTVRRNSTFVTKSSLTPDRSMSVMKRLARVGEIFGTLKIAAN